jgi:hypothetical protein
MKINKRAFKLGVDDVLTLTPIMRLISLPKVATLFVLLALVFLIALMLG